MRIVEIEQPVHLSQILPRWTDLCGKGVELEGGARGKITLANPSFGQDRPLVCVEVLNGELNPATNCTEILVPIASKQPFCPRRHPVGGSCQEPATRT